jgi:hypothetical protein
VIFEGSYFGPAQHVEVFCRLSNKTGVATFYSILAKENRGEAVISQILAAQMTPHITFREYKSEKLVE